MNVDINRTEEEHFCIEDIVSYSNIEISHVNDNRAPMKVIATKVAIWITIIALLSSLFFV